MEYVVLDLEWNGTYSNRMQGFISEIIEFGAVKVDESFHIISTFSHLVRPQISKRISGKIRNLTNLTNEKLMTGMQFTQVAGRFRKWMGDAVLMTWGIADILTLIDNYKYYTGDGNIPFLSRYVDLQNYCDAMVGKEPGKLSGLSALAQELSIDQDDIEHHRALDDSLLALRCFKKLYNKELYPKFVQTVDTEFYNRITFKTTVLCDLSSPLISREDMLFRCEHCGHLAHRESDWVLKNKTYRAQFLCRHCRRRFVGRVQFKIKYEGLSVRKSMVPLEEQEVRETTPQPKKEHVVKVNKKIKE